MTLRQQRPRRRLPIRRHPPVLIGVLAGLGAALLIVPVISLVMRAPWPRAAELLAGGPVADALVLSVWTSLISTTVVVVLGIPLAWVLARSTLPGRGVIRSLCSLSMVLPPVVTGVAMFMAFGRRGVVGRWFDAWFGMTLPFTSTAVILAQTLVALPFLVLTVDGALGRRGSGPEGVARTLGASEWTVMSRVTLPVVAGAIRAGVVLAWARALGEFGATITFAGSFPGRTRTMPLEIYLALETEPERAIMLSLVLVAVSLVVLIGVGRRWLPVFGKAPR